MMKTAILLYLYHTELWDEYKNLILENCSNYTLFLGLCSEKDNSYIISDCKKNFKNSKIEIFKNKGMDIGPFLQQIKNIDEKKYPFFVKLHSKISFYQKTVDWRLDLVNSLIGSKFTYKKNLELIKRKNVGCIFNKSFINNDQSNLGDKIKEILNFLNLSYEKLSNSDYMLGSIYMSKTSVFKKYFSKKIISNIYEKLEGYGKIPEEGSYNHAMEVVSGYIIKNENLKIIDGVVKTKIIYNPDSPTNKIHLVELYNKECTTKENVKIRGKLEKPYIFWKHANTKQEYTFISNKKIIKIKKNLDIVFYKNFNPELQNIKIDDLENHYITIGKKEAKITKEDIKNVFDHNFYKKLYGLKENKYQMILQDYILKGMSSGRIINPVILSDNFDYGFYQSYHAIFENKKYNQYTALNDYIINKKKCNNTIKYIESNIKKKSLCIYSCELKNKKDFYFLKTNLDILCESFDKIVLVCSQKISFKNKKIIVKEYESNNDYKKYVHCLESIPNLESYNSICLLKNNVIVRKNMNYFLKKFLNSNCLLYSIADCYIGTYHLEDSCLLFDGKNYKTIRENLVLFDDCRSLCSNLIKKGYQLGSFFQINEEKELFWSNLFIDINKYPSILLDHDAPVLRRNSVNYLLNLIPKNFIKEKNKGKIQSFFKNEVDKDNLNNIFKINIDKLKFCLVIHIMNFDKFNEYNSFINLLKSKVNIDIFITTNSTNKKESIKNKGMDIGPFIKTLQNIDNNYDYIIKLHSKNLKSFREHCFNNIIKKLYHHVLLLETNDKVLCSGPKLYSLKLDNINELKIKEFMIRNKINIKETTENNFFAGTMFIAKYKPFKEFFNKLKINEEYKILEEKSIINTKPTNTHAWERILTNIIPNYYGMKNSYI